MSGSFLCKYLEGNGPDYLCYISLFCKMLFILVTMLNLRDLRDLPISEGDIVGTKRCV